MYGKLYREWILHLKRRKLYSRFVNDYMYANRIMQFWETNFHIQLFLNGRGGDYVMPYKDKIIDINTLYCCLERIDRYLTNNRWQYEASRFAKIYGYIEVRKNEDSNSFGLYFPPIPYDEESAAISDRTHRKKRSQNEPIGKWFDRFNKSIVKTRYRR